MLLRVFVYMCACVWEMERGKGGLSVYVHVCTCRMAVFIYMCVMRARDNYVAESFTMQINLIEFFILLIKDVKLK